MGNEDHSMGNEDHSMGNEDFSILVPHRMKFGVIA